jgi:hypothetical protein
MEVSQPASAGDRQYQQTRYFNLRLTTVRQSAAPLSRAKDYAAINLGFRCATPQALCYRLLRRLNEFVCEL